MTRAERIDAVIPALARVETAAMIVDLQDEVAELRATLANERGEGEPPGEGWSRNDFDRKHVGIAWYRPSMADGSMPAEDVTDYPLVMWVYREPPSRLWRWEVERDGVGIGTFEAEGTAPTAREAMRAADKAVAK